MREQKSIHGYQILGVLGVGAHSTVYEVADRREQRYALKHTVIKSREDIGAIRQAITEHETSQKFDHPNLRKSFKLIKPGLFSSKDQMTTLLELVEGVSMEDLPGRLDLERFCRWCAQTADALGEMHRLGYVHADIKPYNILISHTGPVKIIDFGQTCKSGTMKKRVQGTPDFMAPEQVNRGRITPLTDVFNLGSTMYYLLTGSPLPTGEGMGFANTGGRKVQGLPTPRDVRSDVPPQLSTLVMQSVERDPKCRPKNMKEFSRRLGLVCRLLSGDVSGDAARSAEESGKNLNEPDTATAE